MRILLAFASCALAGCGANVVFGEDGAGGDGGAPTDELRAACLELCDAQSECPNTDPSLCPAACDSIGLDVPATCRDTMIDFLTCNSEVPDPCVPGIGCSSEGEAALNCYMTACEQEPDQPGCPEF